MANDIFELIRAGDIHAVARMLAESPTTATMRNAEGMSPLMLACYTFDPAMRALLLEHAGEIDVFEAAIVGDADRVAELIERERGLVDSYSQDGFTLLHFAGFFNHADVASILLAAGASVDAVTRNDLANMPLHAAAAGRANEVCRLLLEAGGNPDAKQHGGFTALHEAAHHGNRELVEMLLDHGVDPSIPNDEGETARDIASGHGHIEIVEMLNARS